MEKTDDREVLEFILNEESFAIDLFHIKEIVECQTITKIPSSPPWVKGIIDLRGQITTIVDLKDKLKIIPKKEESSNSIIILDEDSIGSKQGVLVDCVISVSQYKEKDITTNISASSEKNENIIIGVIRKDEKEKGNKLIILIDIKKILNIQ